MVWDFKKEILRKLVHIIACIIIIVAVIFIADSYGKNIALLFLVFLLMAWLVMDFLRVELKAELPLINHLFREKERKRFGGQIFFLVGGIIAYAVFDFDIALAAVLMTGFGDLASSLIGGGLGRIWITKDRNLEGILAEFVVNLAIAYYILGNAWIILTMAGIATIVETLVNQLDDNLFIPVFAGFAGQIASYLIK